MNTLREAAQADALVKELLDESDLCAAEGADDIASLLYRAAKRIAQPETAETAEPVAWQRRYIRPDGPSGWLDCGAEHDWHDVPAEDVAHYANRSDCEVRPLYTHPPRVEWRPPEVTVLPDGSAFGMMSFPLPYDHWMYRDREYLPGADEPVDLPKPILTHALCEHVEAAVRYAVRGATNCGKELDFDPDALVLNAVYALCGPYGGASLRDIEPPTESTIATEIKAARNEFATWPKERQDAARVSAVAMTPPTEGE